MKTHISYHGIREREPVERELRRQGAKFDRQLKKFEADLVDLHVGLERLRQGGRSYKASVTLYLPSTQLNAKEEAPVPSLALKHACAELMRELKKFKAKLRGEDKRRRARRRRRVVSA